MTIQQSQFSPGDGFSLPGRCHVSVVIKALNEEDKIAAAIESALTAVSAVGGEVILADSCSTDRTIEIASRYPILIAQLATPGERCCGVGPQLGYQHARGEYVYILDGDMRMEPDFLPKALALLQSMPGVAGVAGQLVETNTDSLEYRSRAERIAREKNLGEVDRLDGGGLYRRKAVEQAGYFSDRNFHSYEEFDLGVRLRAAGWKLFRIDAIAVSHRGHDTPPYQLLRRRWRSRYICGLGELLRASWGTPRLRLVVKEVKELKLYAAVMAWWALLLIVAILPVAWPARAVAFAALLFGPVALMALRKRSIDRALFAVVSWSFHAAGLVRGLCSPRKPPQEPIASVLLGRNVEAVAKTAA